MRFYTTTLSSGSIKIDYTMGVQYISLQADSTIGSFSVLGNIAFNGISPTAVVITAGNGVNLSAKKTSTSPLDGLTFTWIAGTVDVIIGF
jgi:hypothetical protein